MTSEGRIAEIIELQKSGIAELIQDISDALDEEDYDEACALSAQLAVNISALSLLTDIHEDNI